MAKILVIDDHPELRELFSVVLKGAGHTVITAANGASGLARYARHRPAIVITDLDVPRISGLEVIERLRGERVQIIVISGSDRQSLNVARELGAAVTLKKPFGLHDLAAAVRRLVGDAPLA